MDDLWRVRSDTELAAMALDELIRLYRKQVHSLNVLEELGSLPHLYIDILETRERWAMTKMADGVK